ncbi:MAG TPA: MCE family protein [Rhodospirillales bacterium]|nr:MCE family protein [Rhodospirillales bacterium]
MKNDKVNYMVVGGFILAMLVGLLIFIAKLSAWSGATDGYYAIYRNVTGVKFGAQVLYEGYPIGQVEEVTPMTGETGMRFKVVFSVKKGWEIPSDSISEIAKPGLLSAITLSIRAGSNATFLEPGGQIKGREAADLFAVMSSVAGEVTNLTEHSLKPLLESVRKTTETFGRLMEGEAETLLMELSSLALDMSERLPLIADNIEKFTVKMNRSSDELSAVLSPENREKMNNILTNFSKLSGDLESSREKLDAMLENMNEAASDVNSLVADNKSVIHKSLADLRHVVGSVARHVDSVNQNMEGAARNMYEFSRQIRQNPGLLLGGSPPKDEAPGR